MFYKKIDSLQISDITQEHKRLFVLHLYNQGDTCAQSIHAKTGIPLSTIYRIIKDIKESNGVQRKPGSGRPHIIDSNTSKSIGQYIRHDSTITTRDIAIKLHEQKGTDISHTTVERHLKCHG